MRIEKKGKIKENITLRCYESSVFIQFCPSFMIGLGNVSTQTVWMMKNFHKLFLNGHIVKLNINGCFQVMPKIVIKLTIEQEMLFAFNTIAITHLADPVSLV